MSLFHHRLLMAKALEMANPYLPWDTPKAIKDAMVLYYDIAKQKATNESMAVNPTLKDLSGNGNDATCYNFGWSGMSGIGGYNPSFLTEGFTCDWSKYYHVIMKKKDEIVTVTLDVKGIEEGTILFIRSENRDTHESNHLPITQDGTYSFSNVAGGSIAFYNYPFNDGLYNPQQDTPITVTIHPLYPNALVSDGVNDYCLVQDRYDDEGNLINKKSLVLNKEDGYTVIAKRKILSIANACTVSKRKNGVGTGDESGAFQLERYFGDKYICFSFGSSNNIDVATDDIVYMTSQSYNGVPLNAGNAPDSNNLVIFSLLNRATNIISGVLYSLILFNRDLTTEEIEWVKTNLIETEQ